MKKSFLILLTVALCAGSVYADVALTIYNENLALVKESRKFDLKKGEHEYQFTDVAARIIPTSVSFQTRDLATNLLEQNYEYDLVGTEKLLEKYVDEKIDATTKDGAVFSGTLLSARSGDVILKTDKGQIKVVKAAALQTIEFPELPEGLITRPTLVWLIQSPKSASTNTELSYLTRGLSWNAEYVAVLGADDESLDLSGWVSITNNSGVAFKDANLKLVAGDVNMVDDSPRNMRLMKDMNMAMAEAAPPQFEEESFFEYHLYSLQRPATVKDSQIKQLSLFPTANVACEKIYTYNGRSYDKVRVNVQFENIKSDGLGMPLPKGKLRVYKMDSKGSQEFVGEDRIDHTPVDEKVKVYLGNAFDIVGERVVKDTEKIGRRSQKQTIEITLRNHKKLDVNVIVQENFWGDWEFVGSTPKVVKKDASSVEFQVTVPKDGEKTFEFTVLLK